MTGDVALSLEGVWKRFNRRGAGAPTLHAALANPRRYRRERKWFWALRDVSLDVDRGSALGVIGANGSGKSTLLRLAAGIGRPSRGRISAAGRVSAMLALGESFDPLLTGRENAVTAAMLGGHTRREAQRKLAEIVDFSELHEFIDAPLRTYSSGMMLRLAFAAAAGSANPDVLVVDEVLFVGDAAFRRKCLDRLEELRLGGTAILLASHDESAIEEFCDRALWLDNGTACAQGDPDEVLTAYKDQLRVESERRVTREPAFGPRSSDTASARFGTYDVEIADVRIAPSISDIPPSAGSARVRIDVDLVPHVAVEDPIVVVSVHGQRDATTVADVNTLADGVPLGRLDGPVTVALELDRLDVEPGTYRVAVGVFERAWQYAYDYHWYASRLEIASTAPAATFGPARRWTVLESSLDVALSSTSVARG